MIPDIRSDSPNERGYTNPLLSAQPALRRSDFPSRGGSRVVGTEAHEKAGDYIVSELEKAGWPVETQPFTYANVELRNFIGRASVGRGLVVILGAHYDSRMRADQDSRDPTAPVPGAHDGA